MLIAHGSFSARGHVASILPQTRQRVFLQFSSKIISKDTSSEYHHTSQFKSLSTYSRGDKTSHSSRHAILDLKSPFPTSNTFSAKPPYRASSSTSRSPIGSTSTHHDLPSYLAHHSARISASTDPNQHIRLSTSTVHLGTLYEYLIHAHLSTRLGFNLTRVGGKGDGGVDLIGTWTLPEPNTLAPRNRMFRVLCQAKRLGPRRKPMPALMRELEGTVMAAVGSGGVGGRAFSEAFAAHRLKARGRNRSVSVDTDGANGDGDAVLNPVMMPRDLAFEEAVPHEDKTDLSHLPTLGILITTKPLSDGIKKAMAGTGQPLMYMCLEEVMSDQTAADVDLDLLEADSVSDHAVAAVPGTVVRQLAWNAAASRLGLEGYGVVRKYSEDQVFTCDVQDGLGKLDSEAELLYQGKPVCFSQLP